MHVKTLKDLNNPFVSIGVPVKMKNEYGGKHVGYEWYKPDFVVKHANSAPLPKNWIQKIQPPVDLPLEERDALQFLADNYLI